MADRPGTRRLALDPAGRADATLCHIGRAETPWGPADCPHNLTEARARGQAAAVRLAPEFAEAAQGLCAGQAVIVLYWLDRAARDLAVQAPPHRPAPCGTFALRSPRRPNPIGLAVVRLTGLRALPDGGLRLELDALDCFDGTPVIDVKPWIAGVDVPPPNP